MAWSILVLAGLFEVGWAIGLKYADGFTRLWPSVWTVFALVASMWLLALAMRTLPIGTAYSVWVGIGAVLSVGYAMATGVEPVTVARLLLLAGIVAFLIGLKLLG